MYIVDMKELRKNILGYEGIYQISNKGYVISLDRIIKGRHGKTKLSGKILKTSLSRGYKAVNLWKDSKVKNVKIHRLIGLYFIDNPNNFKCINHINGIKTDNRVENLEWCTHSYNLTHAYEKNLRHNKKAVVQLDLNNNKINEFESLSEAGKSIGKYHSRGCISYCCVGKRKTAFGYKWRFKTY